MCARARARVFAACATRPNPSVAVCGSARDSRCLLAECAVRRQHAEHDRVPRFLGWLAAPRTAATSSPLFHHPLVCAGHLCLLGRGRGPLFQPAGPQHQAGAALRALRQVLGPVLGDVPHVLWLRRHVRGRPAHVLPGRVGGPAQPRPTVRRRLLQRNLPERAARGDVPGWCPLPAGHIARLRCRWRRKSPPSPGPAGAHAVGTSSPGGAAIN